MDERARKAHHWLRGYSDRLFGKESNILPHHDPDSYRRGFLAANAVLYGYIPRG